jgi:phage tail-like protein
MHIRLVAFYVDDIAELNLSGTPLLIANTFPADGAVDVPAADAPIAFATASHPILLTVFDTTVNGLNPAPGSPGTVIKVTTVEDGEVTVWNGTTFAGDWNTYSTFTPVSSDSVVGADEHRFVLVRDTPFTSLDVIGVEVDATNIDLDTLNLVYSFTVEDLTVPVLLTVATRTLERVRLTFDEQMESGTGTPGDVLLLRNITGGLQVLPRNGLTPPRIVAPDPIFLAQDAGMYVGVANADLAINNGTFEILSVIDTRTLEINNELAAEEVLPLDHIATITPYRLSGVADVNRVIPYFNPIVVGLEAVLTDGLVTAVELVLHDSITQNREYGIDVAHVNDVWGNSLLAEYQTFTTEMCAVPVERLNEEFDWLHLIPAANLEQDTTRDLERLLRCLDEVMQLLLCDVDQFVNLSDIDQIDPHNLDAMLASLGAPFTFTGSLGDTDKRRMAAILVDAYKRKGIESGMEALISYLIGVDVDIRPYAGDPDVWVLGDDELGESTYLGPGTQFLLYAFEGESPDALSETQRRRILEVIDYMKPAHTHMVRLLEP